MYSLDNFNKNSIILLGVFFGLCLSYLFNKVINFFKNRKREDSSRDKEITHINGTEDENALIREQLKRNYEFFGNDGMSLIENSFVCVVGIGGVGR
jgi:hypothetical protein